jgi:hypothetical protein
MYPKSSVYMPPNKQIMADAQTARAAYSKRYVLNENKEIDETIRI